MTNKAKVKASGSAIRNFFKRFDKLRLKLKKIKTGISEEEDKKIKEKEKEKEKENSEEFSKRWDKIKLREDLLD